MSKPVIIAVAITICFAGCSVGPDAVSTPGRTSRRYSDISAFSLSPVYDHQDYPVGPGKTRSSFKSDIPVYDHQDYPVGRFKGSFLAGQLTAALKINRPQVGGRLPECFLIVLPIQELSRPNMVSSFGIYMAEQLKTELYLNDFRILCPGQKVTEELLSQVADNPGLFLSPQDNPLIRNLFSSGVKSIVYGSYQEGPDSLYLNVKIISLENREIISVGTCELPKDKNILNLIAQRKFLDIPVSLDHKGGKEKPDTDRRLPAFAIRGKDDF